MQLGVYSVTGQRLDGRLPNFAGRTPPGGVLEVPFTPSEKGLCMYVEHTRTGTRCFGSQTNAGSNLCGAKEEIHASHDLLRVRSILRGLLFRCGACLTHLPIGGCT